MAEWHKACDFIEEVKYQEEKSEIELFRNTRTKRGGEFVNERAESVYNEMMKMRGTAVYKDGNALTQAEIVKSKLGHVRVRKRIGAWSPSGSWKWIKFVCWDGLKKKLWELESTKEKLKTAKENIEKLQNNMSKMLHLLQKLPGNMFEDFAMEDVDLYGGPDADSESFM